MDDLASRQPIIRHLQGVKNNVVVKVGRLVFPTDFVILDVNENVDFSIILGWSFLATSHALLGVEDRKMTLRGNNEEAFFKLTEAMKHPKEQYDTSYAIEETKLIICDCVQEALMFNMSDEYLKEVGDGDGEQSVQEGVPEKPLENPTKLPIAKKKAKSKGGTL